MQPQPWVIEELNRREREKQDARWQPVPLQAPRYEGGYDHTSHDDESEQDNTRAVVIVIDMNDLGDIEDAD